MFFAGTVTFQKITAFHRSGLRDVDATDARENIGRYYVTIVAIICNFWRIWRNFRSNYGRFLQRYNIIMRCLDKLFIVFHLFANVNPLMI
jgi:hypothetical protein